MDAEIIYHEEHSKPPNSMDADMPFHPSLLRKAVVSLQLLTVPNPKSSTIIPPSPKLYFQRGYQVTRGALASSHTHKYSPPAFGIMSTAGRVKMGGCAYQGRIQNLLRLQMLRRWERRGSSFIQDNGDILPIDSRQGEIQVQP